jgi:hypothetical protein
MRGLEERLEAYSGILSKYSGGTFDTFTSHNAV